MPPHDVVSPELALIDADLAAEARAKLVEHDAHDHRPTPVTWLSDDALGALERILQLADVEPPSYRRRFGITKIMGTGGTWAMAGFLVVETHLFPS